MTYQMESKHKNSDRIVSWTLELVNSQTTMTLATAKNDSAWAAPVYYAYRRGFFYFFSNPEARHIVEGLTTSENSAAIHWPSKEWRDIRGIQMAGKIEHVPIGREAKNAFGAYLKKFPFCREFFSPGHLLDLTAFFGQFKVKLYKFKPSSVYYLDNRIQFGHRDLVDLPDRE